MSDVFIRHLSFTRLLLCRLPSHGPLQAMLYRVIVTCDNLPANTLGQMNHERRFQIERERAAHVTDNDKDLSFVRVFEPERCDLALRHTHLIVGHEATGADHAERHVRPV
jgi:hypothetical protein